MQIIKIVLVVVVFSFIFLIFPIFLNVSIVFNYKHKKAYCLLEIYGFIKILSGYMEMSKNIIYIHVSDTKAILFEIVDLDGVKKSFKPFMDYHFISFNSLLEAGSIDNIIKPLSLVFVLKYVQSYIKWYLLSKKPYLTFENKFNVYEDANKLNYFSKTTITLNLLMIIISLIKIIVEKIIYEFRKIRQQN